jgi:hypothetical protein
VTDPTRVETFAPVDPKVLRAELLHIIGEAIDDHPRSQQTAIGPSEVGTACDRRLAYKLAQIPEAARRAPGWRPTVGTAVHAWLEDVFTAWSINHDGTVDKDRPRFLTETRQPVGQILGEDLEGTCDVFDTATLTALDWKVPGPSTMKAARIAANRGECWEPQYEVQAQLYALGWELRGYPVQTVAIMCLPAAGELTDAVLWAEPYDRQVADDALARVERLKTVVAGLGAIAPTILPATEAHCEYCPWYRPGSTNLTEACPGASTVAPRNTGVRGLVAPAA